MLAGRWITTSVVTVVIAIGVGHVMQYGISGEDNSRAMPAPRPASTFRPIQTRSDASVLFGIAPATEAATPEPVLQVSDPEIRTPDLPNAAPAQLPAPRAGAVDVPDDSFTLPPDDDDIGLNGFGLACDDGLQAVPAPGTGLPLTTACPV